MSIRLCIAAAAAFLSGCAALAPEVREVPIPVMVPCITWVPERPQLYFESAWQAKANEFELAKSLLADRKLLVKHADQLEAVIKACAERGARQ